MNIFHCAILSGVLAGAIPLAAAADAPAKPIRHLVYAFTYTQSLDRTMHDSGIGGGPASGFADSRGSSTDKGQITADVVAVQPDTGLVVRVSESAQETRSAEPATCVVYGNTTVICDPNAKVNDEELALLRVLGRNFVDPNQIDIKGHWRIESSGSEGDVASDFVLGPPSGGISKISETRVVKENGASRSTMATDGTILYNVDKSVPNSVVEDSTLRQSAGMGAYDTNRTQVALTLATDSMATP